MTKIFKKISRFIASVVVALFSLNTLYTPVSFGQVAFLPAAGTMVPMTGKYNPVVIKGVELHPDNPFKFDFIVDTGDTKLSQEDLKIEGQKLIGYFLASLTTPEKEMWVNLSPYEKDRIIPKTFGETEMGRDLLSQDYLLKQIMATALYPERQLGQEFWQKVYSEAQAKFGTTNVPVSTFNKVWILPDKAVVYENSRTNSVFVVESSLKVMLEQDYLAMKKNITTPQNDVSALGSQIIREIVIPALTREVNEGKNFAPLRQVYQSLILAAWYKKNLKDNVIAHAYVDRNKTKGVDVADKTITQKIYKQYLQAYRKGVYNYIKEDIDATTQTVIPRKYFSGGVTLMALSQKLTSVDQNTAESMGLGNNSKWALISAQTDPAGPGSDQAMSTIRAGSPIKSQQPFERIKVLLEEKWNAIKEMQTFLKGISSKDYEKQAEKKVGLSIGELNKILLRAGTEIVDILNYIEKSKEPGVDSKAAAGALLNAQDGLKVLIPELNKLNVIKSKIDQIRENIAGSLPAEVSAEELGTADPTGTSNVIVAKFTNIQAPSPESVPNNLDLLKAEYTKNVTNEILRLYLDLDKDEYSSGAIRNFIQSLLFLIGEHVRYGKLIEQEGGQLPENEFTQNLQAALTEDGALPTIRNYIGDIYPNQTSATITADINAVISEANRLPVFNPNAITPKEVAQANDNQTIDRQNLAKIEEFQDLSVQILNRVNALSGMLEDLQDNSGQTRRNFINLFGYMGRYTGFINDTNNWLNSAGEDIENIPHNDPDALKKWIVDAKFESITQRIEIVLQVLSNPPPSLIDVHDIKDIILELNGTMAIHPAEYERNVKLTQLAGKYEALFNKLEKMRLNSGNLTDILALYNEAVKIQDLFKQELGSGVILRGNEIKIPETRYSKPPATGRVERTLRNTIFLLTSLVSGIVIGIASHPEADQRFRETLSDIIHRYVSVAQPQVQQSPELQSQQSTPAFIPAPTGPISVKTIPILPPPGFNQNIFLTPQQITVPAQSNQHKPPAKPNQSKSNKPDTAMLSSGLMPLTDAEEQEVEAFRYRAVEQTIAIDAAIEQLDINSPAVNSKRELLTSLTMKMVDLRNQIIRIDNQLVKINQEITDGQTTVENYLVFQEAKAKYNEFKRQFEGESTQEMLGDGKSAIDRLLEQSSSAPVESNLITPLAPADLQVASSLFNETIEGDVRAEQRDVLNELNNLDSLILDIEKVPVLFNKNRKFLAQLSGFLLSTETNITELSQKLIDARQAAINASGTNEELNNTGKAALTEFVNYRDWFYSKEVQDYISDQVTNMQDILESHSPALPQPAQAPVFNNAQSIQLFVGSISGNINRVEELINIINNNRQFSVNKYIDANHPVEFNKYMSYAGMQLATTKGIITEINKKLEQAENSGTIDQELQELCQKAWDAQKSIDSYKKVLASIAPSPKEQVSTEFPFPEFLKGPKPFINGKKTETFSPMSTNEFFSGPRSKTKTTSRIAFAASGALPLIAAAILAGIFWLSFPTDTNTQLASNQSVTENTSALQGGQASSLGPTVGTLQGGGQAGSHETSIVPISPDNAPKTHMANDQTPPSPSTAQFTAPASKVAVNVLPPTPTVKNGERLSESGVPAELAEASSADQNVNRDLKGDEHPGAPGIEGNLPMPVLTGDTTTVIEKLAGKGDRLPIHHDTEPIKVIPEVVSPPATGSAAGPAAPPAPGAVPPLPTARPTFPEAASPVTAENNNFISETVLNSTDLVKIVTDAAKAKNIIIDENEAGRIIAFGGVTTENGGFVLDSNSINHYYGKKKFEKIVIAAGSLEKPVSRPVNSRGLIGSMEKNYGLSQQQAYKLIFNGQVKLTINGHTLPANLKKDINSIPDFPVATYTLNVSQAPVAEGAGAVPPPSQDFLGLQPAEKGAHLIQKIKHRSIAAGIYKSDNNIFASPVAPGGNKEIIQVHGGDPFESTAINFQISMAQLSGSKVYTLDQQRHLRAYMPNDSLQAGTTIIIAKPKTDRAMNGGIDLGTVNINALGGQVKTAFSDPAQMKMLLKADGLIPVIYKIQTMTVPMINSLLGFNVNQTAPEENT